MPMPTQARTMANRLGVTLEEDTLIRGRMFTVSLRAPEGRQFTNGHRSVAVTNADRTAMWRTVIAHLEGGLSEVVLLECGCPQWEVTDIGHQEGCSYTHPSDRWRAR